MPRWQSFISSIFAALIAGLVAGALVATKSPVAVVGPVAAAVALIVLGLISWFRIPGGVHPFSISVLLLGGSLLAVATIWALTFVHPAVVIAVVLGLAIALAIHFIWHNPKLRHQRTVAGKCLECGYDLRASHDRCPECGTAFHEEIQRRRRIAAALAPLKAERERQKNAWPGKPHSPPTEPPPAGAPGND